MHRYKVLGKKGSGTFSSVVTAENIATGQVVALKRMKAHFKSLEQVNALREIQALKRLQGKENSIQLIEVLFNKGTGKLVLVFELMEKNLYELIKGRRKYVAPLLVKRLMWQLLRCMEHSHKHGIFHRDIKPENILISGDPTRPEDVTLRLADFGSCRGINTKQPYTEYISTRWYRPPECLLTDGYYGHEMDMFSAGCVMFEVLALFPLFPGQDETDQISKIHNVLGTPSPALLARIRRKTKNNPINTNFTPREGTGLAKLLPTGDKQALDLIERCIAYDPSNRCTASEALAHPYFDDVRHTLEQERHTAERERQAKRGGKEADRESHRESGRGKGEREAKKAKDRDRELEKVERKRSARQRKEREWERERQREREEAEREKERERQKERDRQKDLEREIERKRQREKEKDRERERRREKERALRVKQHQSGGLSQRHSLSLGTLSDGPRREGEWERERRHKDHGSPVKPLSLQPSARRIAGMHLPSPSQSNASPHAPPKYSSGHGTSGASPLPAHLARLRRARPSQGGGLAHSEGIPASGHGGMVPKPPVHASTHRGGGLQQPNRIGGRDRRYRPVRMRHRALPTLASQGVPKGSPPKGSPPKVRSVREASRRATNGSGASHSKVHGSKPRSLQPRAPQLQPSAKLPRHIRGVGDRDSSFRLPELRYQ
ncbi:hypothetical protein KIPB_000778 [Kipferlia bialata]|uniref:Protein kinase domain-containing protein n=1 Tax=Kipferlia bialata TaxID=797122 RepID=A0A9K3CPQ1_9EUKA|nr:hypothetical protein KIPB_000778 [Kipferlia bialata]|eukprot:g778.t1